MKNPPDLTRYHSNVGTVPCACPAPEYTLRLDDLLWVPVQGKRKALLLLCSF